MPSRAHRRMLLVDLLLDSELSGVRICVGVDRRQTSGMFLPASGFEAKGGGPSVTQMVFVGVRSWQENAGRHVERRPT